MARAAVPPPDVREVLRRLRRHYGRLEAPRRRDPLDELILTVLSQNTSDLNSERAFASLVAALPTWEAVMTAPVGAVVDAIRPGGLANVKAPRIQAILREIAGREGGRLDLSWMTTARDGRVRAYLTSLPGVGPKTAAVVLAFALARPALPVDTHVHRVAGRLGLLPPGTGADRAHDLLETLVPPRMRIPMHVGLIRLGREICKAGRPRCEVCPLAEVCPTAPQVLGRLRTRAPGHGRLARLPP